MQQPRYTYETSPNPPPEFSEQMPMQMPAMPMQSAPTQAQMPPQMQAAAMQAQMSAQMQAAAMQAPMQAAAQAPAPKSEFTLMWIAVVVIGCSLFLS